MERQVDPQIWVYTVCQDLSVQKLRIVMVLSKISFEPQHDKINKMTCAPSEDSDQPEHPPSWSKSLLCTQWVAKDPKFLHVGSKCPGWSESSLGVQVTLLVLPCAGSFDSFQRKSEDWNHQLNNKKTLLHHSFSYVHIWSVQKYNNGYIYIFFFFFRWKLSFITFLNLHVFSFFHK